MNPLPDAPSDRSRPADGLLHDQRRARRPNTATRLRRSDSQRLIGGVCGGIAAYVDAAPSVIRAVFVLSLVPSIGVTGLAYLLLWWLLPSGTVA